MINGKPLFVGTSENDQIKKIFKIRGTPNENSYPGLKELPEWMNQDNHYDIYAEEDIAKFVPKLDRDGIDLLTVSLPLQLFHYFRKCCKLIRQKELRVMKHLSILILMTHKV